MYNRVRIRFKDAEGKRHTLMYTGLVRYEIGGFIEEQTHKFNMLLKADEIKSFTINIQPEGYGD